MIIILQKFNSTTIMLPNRQTHVDLNFLNHPNKVLYSCTFYHGSNQSSYMAFSCHLEVSSIDLIYRQTRKKRHSVYQTPDALILSPLAHLKM